MKIAEKYPKMVEDTGKRKNCLLRTISPFLTVFSKDLYCRHVETRVCLGKGEQDPQISWSLPLSTDALQQGIMERQG